MKVALHLIAASVATMMIAADARFVWVQALELAAGSVNLAPMALNMRDGLRLRGLQVQHSPS